MSDRSETMGERLVALEVETRGIKSEVMLVRGRVHELATHVGVLTGTVEHAIETQGDEHKRMRDALGRQDADRAALHQENRSDIEKLHTRITGMIWWIVGAQGALIVTIGGLWLASIKP